MLCCIGLQKNRACYICGNEVNFLTIKILGSEDRTQYVDMKCPVWSRHEDINQFLGSKNGLIRGKS